MTKKRLPVRCPSCHSQLKVKKLLCPDCDAEIDGRFDMPALAQLPDEDQLFIQQFIAASGSLKEMAKIRGLSYPTVRNQLNEVIDRLNEAANPSQSNREVSGHGP